MIDKHGEAYREEALDLLADLERSVLELERRPRDRDLIGQIFRQMHTIKGSGAMFGFDAVAAFTHELETAYDWLREGRIAVTAELIGLTLRARDHLLALLRTPEEGGGAAVESGEPILAGFRRLMNAPETAAGPVNDEAGPAGGPGTPWAGFLIHFEPAPGVFVNGTNLPALFDDLRSLGACTVFGHAGGVPALGALDPDVCYLYWDLVLAGPVGPEAIRDVFLFVEDDAVLLIEPLPVNAAGCPDPEILAAAVRTHRGLDGEAVARALSGYRGGSPGDGAVAKAATHSAGSCAAGPATAPPDAAAVRAAGPGTAPPDAAGPGVPVAATPAPPAVAAPPAAAATPPGVPAGSIRVSAEKVDGLMNLVGELVTLEARLAGVAARLGDPDLLFVSEEVDRISQQLRDSALAMRMLPLSTSFGRFRRLVRDLSNDLGKDVEFVTEGGETELDKTVIEQLNDVFVHLIRNAIDHGIEDAATRRARGKPAAGTVRLTAEHSGANVLIQVQDDGAGLDPQRILVTAVERGLVPAGAVLTEKETYGLIMRPGFSTAERVTGISGRGVGMDVVQRAVSALRGSLEIGSRPGLGTRFAFRLPLTLAIIDGLLVQVAERYFVFPQANIVECLEVPRQERENMCHQCYTVVRNEIVPYIDVRTEFGISGGEPGIMQVIIAETGQGKVGVVVDSVVGDYQTVIKPLGALCRKSESISGATILGDGSIALIVDVEKLAARAAREVYHRGLPVAV